MAQHGNDYEGSTSTKSLHEKPIEGSSKHYAAPPPPPSLRSHDRHRVNPLEREERRSSSGGGEGHKAGTVVTAAGAIRGATTPTSTPRPAAGGERSRSSSEASDATQDMEDLENEISHSSDGERSADASSSSDGEHSDDGNDGNNSVMVIMWVNLSFHLYICSPSRVFFSFLVHACAAQYFHRFIALSVLDAFSGGIQLAEIQHV